MKLKFLCPKDKVLLKHGHAHLFTICLRLLLCFNFSAEVSRQKPHVVLLSLHSAAWSITNHSNAVITQMHFKSHMYHKP